MRGRKYAREKVCAGERRAREKERDENITI